MVHKNGNGPDQIESKTKERTIMNSEIYGQGHCNRCHRDYPSAEKHICMDKLQEKMFYEIVNPNSTNPLVKEQIEKFEKRMKDYRSQNGIKDTK